MKYLAVVFSVFLLFSAACAQDSTTALIADAVLARLGIISTGNDALSRSDVKTFAARGLYKVGKEFGVEASKVCTSTANKSPMFIDAELINVVSVYYDSGGVGYSVRALKRVDPDEIVKYQFYNNISTYKNATHYAVFGDSVLLGPVSSNADYFTVRYYKMADFETDSTSVTDLPAEYRELAIIWACKLSSERIRMYDQAAYYAEDYAREKKSLLESRIGLRGTTQ